MSMSELTESSLLAELEALVPRLRERAQETETIRKVPDATIHEIEATGYHGAFRPLAFGGSRLGLSALANGARVLAHGCASSAWTSVFLAQHVLLLGKMPAELQKVLFGEDEVPLIAGTLASTGTATKTEGGYLVSGRSEWNSAIAHSKWSSMQATVGDELRVFYLRVDDIELQDMWNTAGMRGTCSDAFVADEVFVPDALSAPMTVHARGDRHPEQPLLDYPYISVVSLTCSAVVLGAAEAAIEHFAEKIRARVLAFSGNQKQVDQPFGQMRLGEAVARLRMARRLWDSMIVELEESYGRGESLSFADRVGIRSSSALVVQTCRDVVNDVMNAAGGSSYFLTAPLQRIQRDIETAKSHAMFDWDRVAELQGRTMLDLEPRPGSLI
jgi:alkylation response protein AidB-like acyl-CoA dehydrogenase